MKTRIKICCISSHEEAALATGYGAHALGLVGPMPSGPGPIEFSLIREIAASVAPGISSFLLTAETSYDWILDVYHKTYPQVLQLVDAVENMDVYVRLKATIPQVKLVQVIHVTNEESLEEAIQVAEYVDCILLDSGNPKLKIKELGGTGRVHNWDISQKIVEQCGVPVFLAGGLNPKNVREAIDHVNPYGVDICSGLRKNGKLDERLVEEFVKAVN
ncbi:MAG: phosphoribosylanthranilate isomerase [Bacteroidota bacterium]|nr:phosphoribosylanthranilate isomerase [Bacteroidota bacterium]